MVSRFHHYGWLGLENELYLWKQSGSNIYDAKRVDHWYRFAKQRLHWTLPNLRTPEQSERWSDLMPLMSWQLWLARDLVVENVLLQAICYH